MAPSPGSAMIVSAPFSSGDAAEALGTTVAAASSRCAFTHSDSSRAAAPAHPHEASSTARTPSRRLEVVQRVGIEHERYLAGGEQLVAQAQRLRVRPSPGSIAIAPAFGGAARRPRHFTGSSSRTSTTVSDARARRPSRSRHRRERPPRPRQIARSGRRAADGEHRARAVLVVLRTLAAAPVKDFGRHQSALVSECSSPMSATTASPRGSLPGETASPALTRGTSR